MYKPKETPLSKLLDELEIISKADNRTHILPRRYLQDMLIMSHVIEKLRSSYLVAVADDDKKLGDHMDLCEELGL